MSAVAVMLIAIGIADTARRLTWRAWIPPVLAPAVVAVVAALSGLWHPGDLALLVIAAAAGVCWVVLGARGTLRRSPGCTAGGLRIRDRGPDPVVRLGF